MSTPFRLPGGESESYTPLSRKPADAILRSSAGFCHGPLPPDEHKLSLAGPDLHPPQIPIPRSPTPRPADGRRGESMTSRSPTTGGRQEAVAASASARNRAHRHRKPSSLLHDGLAWWSPSPRPHPSPRVYAWTTWTAAFIGHRRRAPVLARALIEPIPDAAAVKKVASSHALAAKDIKKYGLKKPARHRSTAALTLCGPESPRSSPRGARLRNTELHTEHSSRRLPLRACRGRSIGSAAIPPPSRC